MSPRRSTGAPPRAGWLLLGLLGWGACFAEGEAGVQRITDGEGGDASLSLPDAAPTTDAGSELSPQDPHAVLSVTPDHGPFTGGQQVLLRGAGFGPHVRVWFGDTEVDAAELVPVSPTRVQVRVPPGHAGLVTVTTQNATDESTRRSLPDAYAYDAFYLEPSAGPTAGGTELHLFGDATTWADDTKVSVDFRDCTGVRALSPTELLCTAPPGTPGAKPVRVTTADGVSVDVLDAYRYGDSDDGYRGGLSGAPLDGRLKVIALDNLLGLPIPNATVIAGESTTSPTQLTGASGTTVFQASSLKGQVTVTVAKRCFQPQTFVDVPVDSVTVYLDPVLSPACADSGDPPAVGGTPGSSSAVTGEVVWPEMMEFQRSGWNGVPEPKGPDERQVAYVFRLASDYTRGFQLPEASAAITPESEGERGFAFRINSGPGNLTLYALAGIENRKQSPPRFYAYSLGLLRGVSVQPGQATQELYLPMTHQLGQVLEATVEGPTPTRRGPDRVQVNTAVAVADQGYVLLPGGRAEVPLPSPGLLRFSGLPPLVGALAGSSFIVSASAVTGSLGGAPRSVLSALSTTHTGRTLSLTDFVEIPVLVEPALNARFSGDRVELDWRPGGPTVAVSVTEIEAAGGLVRWTIAAPGSRRLLSLPNLGALDPALAPPRGSLSITVSLGHIAGAFDYGRLRYRDLQPRGWTAYARDVTLVSY